ncbi:efflux RND transporter permease subunit [Desulfocicer niacini]
MYTALVKYLIKYRIVGLIIISLITAVFTLMLKDMEMYTQFLDLFPQNHEFVKIHKQYSKGFGGAYRASILIDVENGTVFNKDTIEKIHRIQYAVDLIPGVDHYAIYSIASRRVTLTTETPSGFNTEPLMKEVPKDQEGIERLKKKVLNSNIVGTLVSKDQKSLLLTANFVEGRIDFTKLFDEFMKIKDAEGDSNHRISICGTPVLYGWIYHYVPQMAIIFILTAGIVLLLLFFYMRGQGVWWVPFLCAIMSSIWGLGFTAALGFHFDPLIIVIPFLLSARAVSHAVQWCERYAEELKKNNDPEKAALITGAGLFPPGILGILTDAVGLYVISFTPIPILKNVAYLGTFWAVSVIFTVLIFLPMFFSLRTANKIDIKIKKKKITILERVLQKIAIWTSGRGRHVVVVVALFILLVSLFSSSQLQYGDANPGSPILWPDSEYNNSIERINAKFPGADEMWIVIEGKESGAITYPEVVKGMEGLKQYMMQDKNVGATESFADLIKKINMLVHGNDPKWLIIPSSERAIFDLLSVYKQGTAPGDMDRWVDYTYTAGNVRLFLKDHRGETLKQVIEKTREYINVNPRMEKAIVKPAGGLGGILAAANEVIAEKNHQILMIVLGVIFILCSITYRSIVAGFIFVMSLAMANFVAFSYMVVNNIGLNINTLPVVALGIGIGVDYGLYIVSRIRDAYIEKNDLQVAAKEAVTTAGKAVFFTATMMTAGVAFWWISPLRFQAEMGVLLAILMMVNMLVALIVLPAVVAIVKPKFITKKNRRSFYHKTDRTDRCLPV